MGRLLLFFVLLALLVAIVVILMTIATRVLEAIGPLSGTNEEGLMVPTPYQKITYVALVVLLLGVATGWLGGM